MIFPACVTRTRRLTPSERSMTASSASGASASAENATDSTAGGRRPGARNTCAISGSGARYLRARAPWQGHARG